MDWVIVTDVMSAICLLAGSFLALTASIGLLRFPDLFSRMHAATKPQIVGLLLILAGVAFRLRDVGDTAMIFVVAMFSLLTAPVSAHMVGRTAYRTNPVRDDLLLVDELHDDDPHPPPHPR